MRLSGELIAQMVRAKDSKVAGSEPDFEIQVIEEDKKGERSCAVWVFGVILPEADFI